MDCKDDNLPTSKNIAFESPTDSFVVFSPNETESRSINIYAHFGRPDVWPRGFPLSEVDIQRSVQYLPSYGSLPEPWRSVVAPPALIQQGLADLDPDVDAIFRLTQGQELKRIKYCKESPSIRLSPGSFCPFNSQVGNSRHHPIVWANHGLLSTFLTKTLCSLLYVSLTQNTLFNYDALWGLVLPISGKTSTL